jgi:DNA-binding LacI/PurR family transcriptional regulator
MDLQAKRQGQPAGARKRSGRKNALYRSLTESLRQQLADGAMEAGGRIPPLRELAGKFNVSTTTVRQALRALEQEGQLHCIPGVGTFVRPVLPQRAATQQVTVTFATIEIEAAFTNEIAHGIEEACQERGYSMQLLNAQGDPQIEARNLARLSKSHSSGAIILPVSAEANFEAMVQLKLSGFPLVVVDRVIPGLRVDYVGSDHEKGARLATEYLLDHGHRRVFVLSQQPGVMSSVAARVRGYEEALVSRGIEPLREWKIWIDDKVIMEGFRQRKRWLGGREAALPVLEKIAPPVAIFAHNAYSAWGVFEACRDLGLNIPRDVSIVGFDDAEFTRALDPPLTAIAQRSREIGRIALNLLERRLTTAGTTEPQQVKVDVDLVERQSVASPGST